MVTLSDVRGPAPTQTYLELLLSTCLTLSEPETDVNNAEERSVDLLAKGCQGCRGKIPWFFQTPAIHEIILTSFE
jgi:hypothetical protein